MEPIAAATAPGQTSAQHQSLLHFLAKGEWSDAAVLGKVRDLVLPQIERHGAIEAWIMDESWAKDTERRKKAGVPEEIEFATKPKIALRQIDGHEPSTPELVTQDN